MNRMAHRIGLSVVAVALAGAASAGGPVAAADGTGLVVNDCVKNQAVTEPERMLLACGDGGVSVAQIAWSSWGPDTAEGEATEYRRICEPDCATGHEITFPTHITLRNLQGNYFTQAVIADKQGNAETWPVRPPQS